MIHDRLFVARHCLVDGKAMRRMEAVKGVDSTASVQIIGEAIRTLLAEHKVAADDVAAATVTAGVSTPISRTIWNKMGGLREPAAVERGERNVGRRGLPGVPTAKVLKMFGVAAPPPPPPPSPRTPRIGARRALRAPPAAKPVIVVDVKGF